LLLQRYRRSETKAKEDESRLSDHDDPHYVPYVPVRERKREKLAKLGDRLHKDKASKNKDSSESEKDENSENEEDAQALARKENISLLDQHTELKRIAEGN